MSPDAPPPPPPSPYQPAPAYAPAPASGSVVRLPAGMTLWDLIGFLMILVGGILVLVGFLLGEGAIAAQTSSPPNASTFQNDYEGFFIWTGIGAFLTILGWLVRAMIAPILTSRKSAASSAMATPMPAPAPAAPAMAPAAPPPVAPAPVPAAPVCPKCGKPTTYIAQYSRYYCYTDAQYV